MAEITNELRQIALNQLHDLVKLKKFNKSPESVEEMIFEKSRGNYDTYFNMLQKLKLYPTPGQSGQMNNPNRLPMNQNGPNVLSRNNSMPQMIHNPGPDMMNQPTIMGQNQMVMQPNQLNEQQKNFHVNNSGGIPMQIQMQNQQRMSMRPNHVQNVLRPNQTIMSQRPQIVSQGNQNIIRNGNNFMMQQQQSMNQPMMTGNRMMQQPNIMTNRMANVYPQQPQQINQPMPQQQQSIPQGSNQFQMMPGAQQPPPGPMAQVQSQQFRVSAPNQVNQQRTMTPDEEKIVEALRCLAQKYLASVQQAYLKVREHPQSSESVLRKYAKLKEILERPEVNYGPLKLNQISKIEQLLDEVEKNPFHLLNQTLRNQVNKGNQGIPRQPGSSPQMCPTAGPQFRGQLQSAGQISHPPPPPQFCVDPRMNRLNAPHNQKGPMYNVGDVTDMGQSQHSEFIYQQKLHQQAQQNRIKNLQKLIRDMERMAESEKNDPVYSEQVSRAVHEICIDTKPFREMNGLQVSQDIISSILEENSDEFIGNPLSDLTMNEINSNKNAETDQKDAAKAGEEVKKSAEKRKMEEAEKSDPEDLELFIKSEKEKKVLIESPLEVTEAMTRFPGDAIRYLNKKVKHEICQVTKMTNGAILVKGVITPPPWKQMETQQSCMSPYEWNNSCHISLCLTSKLPINVIIPDLFIRIPPSYLNNRRVMWWYNREQLSDCQSKMKLDEDSFEKNTDQLIENKFIELFLYEADQKLNLLQKFFVGQINLMMISKAWLDAIQSATRRAQVEY